MQLQKSIITATIVNQNQNLALFQCRKHTCIMHTIRRKDASQIRRDASHLAESREHPPHHSNGDEQKYRHKKDGEVAKCHDHQQKHHYTAGHVHKEEVKLEGKPSYLVSFTKGMPHNYFTGLLQNPLHMQYFIRGIDSGDPRDFRDTPLGPDHHSGATYNCHPPKGGWKSIKANEGSKNLKTKDCKPGPVGLRAWESQSAGLAFDLEGPDAQAVTMPPAPALGSPELTAEMGEVYVQALLRDVPFHAMTAGVIEDKFLTCDTVHAYDKCPKIPATGISNKPILKDLHTDNGSVKTVLEFTEELKKLPWFGSKHLKLTPQEEARRCGRQCPNPGSAFRGITTGDEIGPYISQFLLIGNTGINGCDPERNVEDGYITYGALNIDQRVRNAEPINYLTKWEEWFDAQNAASLGGLEQYVNTAGHKRRFIFTPRDLATYVHYDALYEAYLNACLILLSQGAPFDPGIPFQDDDSRDHQQGFAHFGGPHILSLVTEVATRALKAVRFQKYNIHRRCRPEVLAARITKIGLLGDMAPELAEMHDDLGSGNSSILAAVNASNGDLFESKSTNDKNYLLPMAFCEGSPMHPAYGAGHATVAGACVTILKAFFDCKAHFKPDGNTSKKAFVSIDEGKKLALVPVKDQCGKDAHLTIEGELNKLASNIAIGRNWAGVHYFTDYYESILMGEKIAIGILEEQKLTFGENFSMTLPKFDGTTVRI